MKTHDQRIRMAEADLALGVAWAARPRPDLVAGSASRAIGVGGTGRQADIRLAVRAVERIERQIAGPPAPPVRALDDPVARELVARSQVVSNAGKRLVDIAARQLGFELF